MRIHVLSWVAFALWGCGEAELPDDPSIPGFFDTGVAPAPVVTDTGTTPSTPAPTGGGGYADCLFGTETVCFCQSCDTPDRRPTFDLYLNSCIDNGEYRPFVLCYVDQIDPLGGGRYGIDCPLAWENCRGLLP